jgi:CheY-like chemotaxis protein
LKGEVGHSELLPVWQMASALEGLIKQLTDNADHITASTLRTLAGAVDVVGEMCRPSLKADLLTNPPLRLLVVDDDPICRAAVSAALKKALNPPDLAENGEVALSLATQRTYDVIFLDVLMPGMDGFETCTKIHEAVYNAHTPVVFVTTLSDFDARAKATVKGGADLIGKPFLSFEITVKALTFALRGRLQPRAQIAGTTNWVKKGSIAHLPAHLTTPPTQNPPQEAKEQFAAAPLPETLADDRRRSELLIGSVASEESSPRELMPESAELGPLRDLIQKIFKTSDECERQQILSAFSVRLHDLASKGTAGTGHPAFRLSAALEGLVRKLMQDPKHGKSSAFLTIATAVDLLHELCAAQVSPDLAANPPIRILAVDDDPVARRAITCALQMAFEKPEGVDSGEAALALATQKPFDVIFMDVLMPSMDGFTACLRIHETDQNRTTPVVFVTSLNDFKARSQATISGGSDFIAKPFLTAEITVKALTYALRGRLQKRKAAQSMTLPQKEEKPKPDNLSPALKERILFVDDEEGWRTMVAEVLRGVGYEVVTAANGSEAMHLVDGGNLGTIILDLNLAGEDGLTLMGYLHCNQPGGVPVILYTGMEHDEATVAAMRAAGANEYLRKGPMEELVGAVRRSCRSQTVVSHRTAAHEPCPTGGLLAQRGSFNNRNDHADAEMGCRTQSSATTN